MEDFNNFDNENYTITAIILGNGFDIANGFNTRYADFINSNYFEKLIDSNNALAIYIKSIYNLKNWVDVENELGNYSYDLEYSTPPQNLQKATNEFEQEYYSLKLALHDFIQSQTAFSQPSYMENLIQNWNNLTLPVYHTKLFIATLNYNRWDTTTFISKTVRENILRGYPIHIHGVVNQYEDIRDTNIVLGVDQNSKRGTSHNFIVKAFDKNANVRDYFNTIQEAHTFIIFGCSIGQTDTRYFKPIFGNAKNKEFKIYGYKDRGLADIKQNISKLCNYDDFITYNDVRFIDTSKLS